MSDLPVLPSVYYSIDVECVATGFDHNSRAVGQVSLVDQSENCILNLYVKPDKPVVSYLTHLTGLTKESLDGGLSLEEAIAVLRSHLPKAAVLVGQNIRQDVVWLGLKEGEDFLSMQDLAGLYRIWNPRYNTWSVFGQDHVAKILLNWDTSHTSHNAVIDATKSIRLFNYYYQLQAQPGAWEAAQNALLVAPVEPSFAKKYPTYEGVCMGNRKQCSCKAPFFS